MSRSIWKYPVSIEDEFEVQMPCGSQILSVQVQGDQPFFWASVEKDNDLRKRRFAVRGTGHPTDDVATSAFIGTFQLHAGQLVFHLFDRGPV